MHPTPENAPHPDRGVHWYRGDTCLPNKNAHFDTISVLILLHPGFSDFLFERVDIADG